MALFLRDPPKKADMSSKDDPPISIPDRACAALARMALFPLRVDWDGSHHAIYPALKALDIVRKDVASKEEMTSSYLFPKRVMVVPSKDGAIQWSGQPDIVDSSVEVIPDILTVKCMECSESVAAKDARSFVRTKEHESPAGEKNVCHEIVLCTNRLLQNDYDSTSSDPTLLEQRKDCPPRSLAAVEEALAHEITIVRDKIKEGSGKSANNKSPCEKLAHSQIQAARVAECMFQEQGKEIRRGSRLKPPGFSLVPGFLQKSLQDRCIRAVATQATSREFGKEEGKKCVDQAWNSSQ